MQKIAAMNLCLLPKRNIALILFLCWMTLGCKGNQEKLKLPPLNNQNVREELLKFGRENPETVVLISTSMGEIKVKLFEDTPLHRANFIRLVKMGFYDKTVFHRVLKNATIQGGNSREAKMPIGDYTIPTEINARHVHTRGALAMARYDDVVNPTRASSADNFYIVQGYRTDAEELHELESLRQFTYSPGQIKTYSTIGGMPSLDMKYTVFGEVIEGMDVVDKIARVPVDTNDWPDQEIYITMEVVE
jgi:peptidyl-prolyl cis-trans isomerase B (cyclophilin B)